MNNTKILLAFQNGEYLVKVKGRANFETSPPIRTMTKNLETNKPLGITFDLSECTGMDSTFMGILAMVALKAKNLGLTMKISGADENCRKLLNGLGLNKIFAYVDEASKDNVAWSDSGASASSRLETAKTVLEAHETLMNVDEENVKRFKNVVDFVKKDIESEEKKKSSATGEKQP